MSEAMIIAIINLVTRVGFAAASVFLQRIGKPNATIDDAIEALDAGAKKSAEDYLSEARAKLTQTTST